MIDRLVMFCGLIYFLLYVVCKMNWVVVLMKWIVVIFVFFNIFNGSDVFEVFGIKMI